MAFFRSRLNEASSILTKTRICSHANCSDKLTSDSLGDFTKQNSEF